MRLPQNKFMYVDVLAHLATTEGVVLNKIVASIKMYKTHQGIYS